MVAQKIPAITWNAEADVLHRSMFRQRRGQLVGNEAFLRGTFELEDGTASTSRVDVAAAVRANGTLGDPMRALSGEGDFCGRRGVDATRSQPSPDRGFS